VHLIMSLICHLHRRITANINLWIFFLSTANGSFLVQGCSNVVYGCRVWSHRLSPISKFAKAAHFYNPEQMLVSILILKSVWKFAILELVRDFQVIIHICIENYVVGNLSIYVLPRQKLWYEMTNLSLYFCWIQCICLVKCI